jgi:alkylresorcinol/alkylpyrone synthase
VPSPVALLALSTASPPNILRQDEVAAAARSLLQDRFPGFNRMAPVFTTAGINTRQSAMPIEWFFEPRGWPERTEVYQRVAVDLFVEAATRALDDAGRRLCSATGRRPAFCARARAVSLGLRGRRSILGLIS